MDEPRLTLRLSRDLWRVVRLLRERWSTTNEGVVRKLISDAGGLPAPSDWLRGAIDRASAPRIDEESRPTQDQHGRLIKP